MRVIEVGGTERPEMFQYCMNKWVKGCKEPSDFSVKMKKKQKRRGCEIWMQRDVGKMKKG